jgi:hypothetical protein
VGQRRGAVLHLDFHRIHTTIASFRDVEINQQISIESNDKHERFQLRFEFEFQFKFLESAQNIRQSSTSISQRDQSKKYSHGLPTQRTSVENTSTIIIQQDEPT